MENQRKSYERPCIQVLLVELEQGIATGTVIINTAVDNQALKEREFENVCSNNSNVDL